MKILSGTELAGFIKERQAKQVRNLKQAHHIAPRLAIVRCNPENRVISTYVQLKQNYGEDIGVEVEVHEESVDTIRQAIEALNAREDVHGIIVQLPVVPHDMTDELLSLVDPSKDVDSLGDGSVFDAATPMAILWLLAGYNVTLEHVALVGRGRLVGAPLEVMLRNSGVDVAVYDRNNSHEEMKDGLLSAQIVITATGQPGIVDASMLAQGAVVVDAGVASEDGVLVGDVAADVRERDDLTITPEKGGVGPLTVAALFDNVLRAARMRTEG